MAQEKCWLHHHLKINMNATFVGLIGIIGISAITGWLFSRSKKREKPVMVMLFVFYFWLFVFIQLGVFAVLYKLGMLEGLV